MVPNHEEICFTHGIDNLPGGDVVVVAESHETKRDLPRDQRYQCAALVYHRAEDFSEVRARRRVDLYSHRAASDSRGSDRRLTDRFFRRRSGGPVSYTHLTLPTSD